jgi:hypothetical protein
MKDFLSSGKGTNFLVKPYFEGTKKCVPNIRPIYSCLRPKYINCSNFKAEVLNLSVL